MKTVPKDKLKPSAREIFPPDYFERFKRNRVESSTLGGRTRERLVTLTGTRTDCQDRPIVMPSKTWQRIRKLAEMGGWKWPCENFLTPNAARQVGHALEECGLQFTDPSEQKALEDVMRLCASSKGLKIGMQWADQSTLSLG